MFLKIMRRILLAIVAILILLVGVVYFYPCGTYVKPHGLRIFEGEEYYRCPRCSKNEFGPKERFSAIEAPWFQYGDDGAQFKRQPNGNTKIKHGFTKKNFPNGEIIEIRRGQ